MKATGKYLGDRVEVTGEGAGAQVVVWPRKAVTEAAVVTAAAQRGVRNLLDCALLCQAARKAWFVAGVRTLDGARDAKSDEGHLTR